MKILDTAPWLTLGGEEVGNIRQKINNLMKSDTFTLHVGTDTKPHSDATTLITTICFRENRKGALVVYQKRKINVFQSVLDRLLYEAVTSLELAEELRELTGVRCTIHADVNPGEKNLSNRVADAIMGMVNGMGYEVLIKPDAWAADIADMYTR